MCFDNDDVHPLVSRPRSPFCPGLAESRSILLGGEVMTLMMGLRFFTDHLQGNIYYRVSYSEQNFHRAKNQMIFLQSQQAQREKLSQIWEAITGLEYFRSLS